MSVPTPAEIFEPASIQAARDRLARLEADYPSLLRFTEDTIGLSCHAMWKRRADARLQEIATLRWRIERHEQRKTA